MHYDEIAYVLQPVGVSHRSKSLARIFHDWRVHHKLSIANPHMLNQHAKDIQRPSPRLQYNDLAHLTKKT
jgi:hypothetical protein